MFYGILALVSLLGMGITQSARANLITNGHFERHMFLSHRASRFPRPFQRLGSVNQYAFERFHGGTSYSLSFGRIVMSRRKSVLGSGGEEGFRRSAEM
jgi:hypothetical protein